MDYYNSDGKILYKDLISEDDISQFDFAPWISKPNNQSLFGTALLLTVENQKARLVKLLCGSCLIQRNQHDTGNFLQRSLASAITQGSLDFIGHLSNPQTLGALKDKTAYFGAGLAIAAKCGNKKIFDDMLELFQKHRRDWDRHGAIVLKEAAAAGHSTIVKQLLELPPDEWPLTRKSRHCIVLEAAAGGGHLGIVQNSHGILQQFADDQTDLEKSYTVALIAAARKCYVKVIEALLPLATQESKMQVLVAAVGQESLDSVKMIIMSAGGIPSNWYGEVLVAAAASKNHEVFRYIFGLVCDINARNKTRQTLLIGAVWAGEKSNVEMILAYGRVDINAADRWGRTALIEAAEKGMEDITRIILETPGINVNLGDDRTALIIVAEAG